MKYNWNEIEKYIIHNAGKYTRTQICEKVNIPYKTLAQHIIRNCPELEKYIINEHKKDKYDWTEIDQFIMDNAGKYTRSEICEEFNIPYKTLIGHIKRCYPEFEIEKYIKREVNEYDWKEIEQFIMDNAGKYTKLQICKKFDISATTVLMAHIQNECPELNKCFTRQTKYDWNEIEQFIMDNAGKYTKKQICEEFDIVGLSVLTRHIQRSCPELENYIKRGFREYDWNEIEKYIMDNAGKYTRLEICKKFNIGYTGILNNHIRNNCPELLNCFVCN
jgi:hypothetical protein